MSSSTKRRDAKEISAAILQTTEFLFTKYGVENVSMHQIAKAAKVGQGTMYRRYANKGDLCMDLMKEHFQSLQEETIQYLKDAKAISVKERIQVIFKRLLYYVEQHSRLFEAIQSYTTCEKTKKPFYDAPPYVFMHNTIRLLLEEAIETKVVRPINADFTAHTLLSSINPKMYIFLRQKNGYTAEEIIENFNKSLLEPLFY
ncbi:TetR/AcrR family transcriptional regulator [Bacillus sp. 03113]|uniref:TetR/AcrR family transcriptional regulator n=1 Tax=Bacillus sp. 03113 TaxID=2578211 RepID=UPI0011411640|nr:TetR/AcrR family transcriptional regulator [Bacillus sp. 03113]